MTRLGRNDVVCTEATAGDCFELHFWAWHEDVDSDVTEEFGWSPTDGYEEGIIMTDGTFDN